MSDYLTEEEQIERIKKWWKQYGNYILTVVIILLLAFTGWRWWQQRHNKILSEASTSYEYMLSSVANNDPTGATAQANSIISNYGDTSYAGLARMMLARQAVYAKDYKKAIAQLQAVVKEGNDPVIKQIARIRAARLLLVEKQDKAALALLQTVDAPSFKPLIAEVKGDIYFAMGNKQQARQAYALALAKLPSGGLSRPLLEMKLNDLAVASPQVATTKTDAASAQKKS